MIIFDTEHRLPEAFVKQGLEWAKTARLFGVPVEGMTREELKASVCQGWKRYAEMVGDLTKDQFMGKIDQGRR